MRTRTISKLLAAAVSIAPGVAVAQMRYMPVYNPGGTPVDLRSNRIAAESMLPDRDTQLSIDIYAHTLLFASCAEKQNPGLVRDVLGSMPNTSTENRLFDRTRSLLSSCNPEGAVNILTLMRGSLSEAKYKDLVLGEIDPKKITATSDDSQAFLDFEQKWNSKRLANDQKLADVTNCLVVVQPDIAHKLLLTRHGSVEETAALDDLFAKASPCAGKMRPRISSSFLRAFIADSMYQLAISKWQPKFLPWTKAAAK